MKLRSNLRFVRALIATNAKASLSLRGASWLQIISMLVNNAAFFAIWWIIFDRYDQIRGWKVADMAALYGIAAGGFGLAVVFAGGVRFLAHTILDSGLDSWLTQPRSVLMQAAMSRSIVSGWGDVLTAIVFLSMSGLMSPLNVPLVCVLILTAGLLFIGTNVLIQSMAFWLAGTRDLGRQICDFVIVFSTAPGSIFDGWLRVILFTVIPAGFIGYLPVGLLRDFDPLIFAAILAATIIYLTIASAVFRLGLRHYTSGNLVGLRRA